MQTSDASNFFRTETELAKDEARKEKAERTKHLGAPLDLPGKILGFKIRGSEAWTAESGHVVRRLSLESGKTLQLYKGHSGPVTCLAFLEPNVLLTGSWDKTIKAWNILDKSLLSSTSAHGDFVKVLLVVSSLSLLVSGSSDKAIRFWDLSDLSQPLKQLGLLSAHTRPVETLAFEPGTDSSGTLYTADTMGVMKVWTLDREYGDSPRCRGTLKTELSSHRTGVNDLWVGKGFVWSGSSDDTLLIQPSPVLVPLTIKKPPRSHSIVHPNSVKAVLPLALTDIEEPYLISASGDVIRTYAYDASAPDDPPELLSETDAHWHDVTALGLWLRVVNDKGNKRLETWILSASLDATLRRWQLADLVKPKPRETTKPESKPESKPEPKPKPFQVPPKQTLTEDEERELAELMDSD